MKHPPFQMLPHALINSPTIEVLSRAGFQALMKTVRALAKRKGKDNGRLPITYDDFEAFGIHRRGIAPAIRELQALGILTVKPGSGGRGACHAASLYGLTYESIDGAAPTNDFQHIATRQEAETIAAAARKRRGKGPNGPFATSPCVPSARAPDQPTAGD